MVNSAKTMGRKHGGGDFGPEPSFNQQEDIPF
jgi:hypothetical protein